MLRLHFIANASNAVRLCLLDGLKVHVSPTFRHTLQARTFSSSPTINTDSKDLTKGPNPDEKAKDSADSTSHDTNQKMVRVHYLDKKTLVWDKRYKSMEDVPAMLPYQTVVQSRNRFRIRVNLLMIALTVLAALGMVYTGKERAKAGESVERRTLERHRQLRAQKAEEDGLSAAAQSAGPDK